MKATGNSSSKFWAAGALAALMALASPAFAQHSGGGHGGGGGGGGAHFSGGGGHVGGGGFGGRPGGFSGGHAALGGGGFAGGARYAPRVGYSGFRGGYVGGHVASAAAYRGGYAGGRVGFAGRPNAFVGRAGYAGHPGYGYGYGRGGFGWSRPYWGGGYFHGGYWPRAYYGWSYPWFLGVLPGVYATYWWGGIPYYYANDVYYTWNGGYNGYVATDPPPAADSESSGAADGDYAAAEPGSNADAGGSTGNAGYNSNNTDVYAYPKDGQSDEQQSTDRYECHKWAVAQSGFDPTHPSTMAGNRADYRRAMTACLDGRGYSAK